VTTRRDFLVGTGLAMLATACSAPPFTVLAAETMPAKAGEGVAPPEDLMREHGVLNRILLIYEEALRRLDGQQDLDPAVLAQAAGIIRHFIEEYHEKLEEDHLFPRFEKAGKLVALVHVLKEQHQAGRRLTATILRNATAAGLRDAGDRRALQTAMRQFIRMYRPHEAREDTVLFPALRSVVTPKEFDAMGDMFEDKEHQLFGQAGFEGVVEQVAALERSLGIYDLAQFTPR
jgi:hemerythrin-like domain-containing protein